MKFDNAENAFAKRLYEWSLKDLLREMESGCPLLSLIGQNQRIAGAFVRWNEELPDLLRPIIAEAMVSRGHLLAQNGGIPVSNEAMHWANLCYGEISKRLEEIPPLPGGDKNSPVFEAMNGYEAVDMVVSCLDENFGTLVQSGYVVRCCRNYGDWKLATTFKFEKRWPAISFEYRMVRKDKLRARDEIPHLFPRSLLSFYGIYNSTLIMTPSKEDGFKMAPVVVRLAKHFILQAESLFQGLNAGDR